MNFGEGGEVCFKKVYDMRYNTIQRTNILKKKLKTISIRHRSDINEQNGSDEDQKS